MIFGDNVHLCSLIYNTGEVENIQTLDYFNIFVNTQLVYLFESMVKKEYHYNFIIAKKFDFLTKLTSATLTKSSSIICLTHLVYIFYLIKQ